MQQIFELVCLPLMMCWYLTADFCLLDSVCVAKEEEKDGNVQPCSQEEDQSAKAAHSAGDVPACAPVSTHSSGQHSRHASFT